MTRIAAPKILLDAALNDYTTPPAIGDVGPHRFTSNEQPDLRFTGQLLASYTTEKPGRTRWTELHLYRTAGGAFVALAGGLSSEPGHVPFWRGGRVETVRGCLEVWGWDSIAKAFARRLGWSTAEHID